MSLSRGAGEGQRRRREGEGGRRSLEPRHPIALRLDPQDIRRALVAREQVRPVFRPDKRLQCVDAREQPDQIVAPARENRIDQIVANAGFALLDFEAVEEEIGNVETIVSPYCDSRHLLLTERRNHYRDIPVSETYGSSEL